MSGFSLAPDFRLGLASTPLKGGGQQPSPGYSWLRGKDADGSYTQLTGQITASGYVKLQGKVA